MTRPIHGAPFAMPSMPTLPGLGHHGPAFAPDDGTGGGAPPAPAAATPEGPTSFSREYVADLRSEAKSYRLKVAALETSLAEAKTATERAAAEAKTAAERATADAEGKIAAATKTFHDGLIAAEVKASALANGLAHPDFVKLVDASVVKIEDGAVKFPETFWADVKAKLPHLFAATGADRGTTSNPNPAPKPAPTGPVNARTMTDADYKAAEAALLGRH